MTDLHWVVFWSGVFNIPLFTTKARILMVRYGLEAFYLDGTKACLG